MLQSICFTAVQHEITTCSVVTYKVFERAVLLVKNIYAFN